MFLVAMLAGFDQSHSFVQGRSIYGYDVLLFRRGVEEVARHCGRILSSQDGHFSV